MAYSPFMRELSDEVRFVQGQALMTLGRFSYAILVLDDLIARHPSSIRTPDAWRLKGSCLATKAKQTNDPWLHGQAFRSFLRAAGMESASARTIREAMEGMHRCLKAAGYSSEEADTYVRKLLTNSARAGSHRGGSEQ